MMKVPQPARDYMPEFRATLPQWKGPQLYLIACAPKAASTYAAAIVSEYLGSGVFFAGKIPNRAVQDIDGVWVESAVAAGKTIIHQHVPWHPTTHAYIEAYRIRPVALVRDLADTIPSIRDHLRHGGNGSWPGVHVDKSMIERSDSELDVMISHLIMPWYFTFYAGWLESGYPLLTYEQVVSSPETLIRKLGLPLDHARLEMALAATRKRPTRFNVGKPGRGQTIASEAREHLRRLARHYSHIDLAPIMSGGGLS